MKEGKLYKEKRQNSCKEKYKAYKGSFEATCVKNSLGSGLKVQSQMSLLFPLDYLTFDYQQAIHDLCHMKINDIGVNNHF